MNPVPFYSQAGAKVGLEGAAESAGKELTTACLENACFVAGTQVVVGVDNSGQEVTKNIEDIHIGDWVLTKNQFNADAPLEMRQVTQVMVHTADHLRVIQMQEADGTVETIRVTDTHPFWVQGLGWVAAGDLQSGAQLLAEGGQTVIVVGNTYEAHPEGIAVYNFTVDADHTYFVTDAAGDEAVWVHNDCLRANMEAAGEVFKAGEEAAHIVPRELAGGQLARDVLKLADIGINETCNGFKALKGHLGTHSEEYLDQLGERLLNKFAEKGSQAVRKELDVLWLEIMSGAWL